MRKILILVVAALAAGACSTGPDLGSPDSYALVCDGMAHEWAPELGDGDLNKVDYMYSLDGTEWTWDPFVGDASSDWASFGTTETALVVCMNVVSTTELALCEFEDGFTQSKHTTDYEITLRAASTGEIIDQTTATAPGDPDCGMFIMTSSGDDKHEIRYGSPAEQISTFLQPHVEA
jgi:hypothetical protein